VNAVAPSLRPEEDHQVGLPRGPRPDEALGTDETHAHRVNQRVPGVSRRELDLAAHGRDPYGVAVPPDAAHDLPEEVTVSLVVQRPEPERVQEGDGPRAHRQDVPDDAADAGRRSLVGLDRRRVVVALHLEGERPPVTDLDHARVLPWPLQHPRPFVREPYEKRTRVLVAAVLAPHHAEERELQVVRRAAHQLQDAVVLEVREP
jgi:hypothetical protein